MVNNSRPTGDELQEKVLYDIIQYLPLDKLDLEYSNNINQIIRQAEKRKNLGESEKNAIAENLPKIKAILKDRPELGKAKISNMSWKDNDGDEKPDYSVYSMQA
jgi:hypothetical protein